MKYFLLTALLVGSVICADAQGLKLPALSPNAKISQDFSLSSIEISYSRPSMRGRKIFGDVVGYGRVWRTGANAPTRIKIGEELMIGGHKVKAGEYALYTVPNRDKWEVILNNSTGGWSANGFPIDNDVARFTVRPITTDEVTQTFTISINDITYTSCKIELAWERTKIVIPVVANNNDSIEVSIDKAINRPPKQTLPYFSSANYYYETGRKLDLAKTYVDKAIEQDAKAYYIWYLKARIEKKLGNNADAIAAAKKSMELTKGASNEAENNHNNQKILDEVAREKKPRQEMDPQ
ncbi:MAG: hypothetical protein K0Q79_3113 [Flavipsychrobacter sp.]|jgi:hypothetical protein|nr:hypothetical protein [Flavipsychrobacter sp.]